jgi:hypothetical protein
MQNPTLDKSGCKTRLWTHTPTGTQNPTLGTCTNMYTKPDFGHMHQHVHKTRLWTHAPTCTQNPTLDTYTYRYTKPDFGHMHRHVLKTRLWTHTPTGTQNPTLDTCSQLHTKPDTALYTIGCIRSRLGFRVQRFGFRV